MKGHYNKRTKQLILGEKMQSLVAQHERKRNKLLHDEPMTWKQKSDAQTVQNLHLNVLLDKCQNNKCIAR